MAANPPVDVQEYGQSIWYDNISRALLEKGEIQRLADEDGVMGITSNPTIFMKAIGAGSAYDEAIGTMLDLEPYDIYERLAVADIQAAADILRPIYDRTEKLDGYVSLEVSPLLANDTTTTLEEARRLFQTVDRPNVMIKIPATEAGLPAIEDAIADGINVNITLIFSVDNYKDVAERYIRGLERRAEAGQTVAGIGSVASFFLSRIDSAVDQQLQNNIRAAQGRDLDRVRANDELLGTIAIASAKAAFAAFRQLFNSQRFIKLREAGAMVQRPLWASTSTKNPSYPDTMYVDELIGPNTVNTVPPNTLAAFKDHGSVSASLERRIDDAHTLLDKLAEVGVDLDQINRMLQADGVDAFIDSFERLLEAVEGKREMLRCGVIQKQHGVIGGYEPGVRRTIDRLAAKGANRAIWQREPEFWKEGAQHRENILNRLGWLTIVNDGRIDRQRLADLQAVAQEFETVVLLGMGGSSLAPEVLYATFGKQDGYPKFLILDSTDPAQIKHIENNIELTKTLFVVTSKSGSTLETDSFRRYFYDRVKAAVGEEQAGQHFIAITDEGTPLTVIAKANHYRDLFVNPDDIGGRYAALSYVGLVPAALMGLDLDRFYASAERMLKAVGEIIPAQGHPGIWLGAMMGYLAQHGHDKLSILPSPSIASFSHWAEQLVAESTGKEGKGILPVAGSTVGNPHDYDDDRFIVYMRLGDESPDMDKKMQTLWEAGNPVFTIELDEAYDIAGEFLRWEFGVAVAAHLLDVNPFDEPNVDATKAHTRNLLEYYQRHQRLPTTEPYLETDEVALYVGENTGAILDNICAQRNYSSQHLPGMLAAHISFARSGDYIGLLAYLEQNQEDSTILEKIRRRLRHSTTRAVTVGYGPRYLHSTGQYHKGGPDNGIFIQITVDDPEDVDIPGQPYSFSVLKQAQALGDQQALMERALPFVRLHIKGNIPNGLAKILEAIEVAEEKQI